MRKIIFSLLTFLSATSLCFAEQVQAPVSKPMISQTAQAPVKNKTLTGKVDLVIIGDVAKGIKSEIVVVTDDGQKSSFVVNSGTPITDKDAKTLTLSDLKKEHKVTVEYAIEAGGINKVQSIKLVE